MRSTFILSLAVYIGSLLFYSCGKESAGGSEAVATPVFGSDQVIANREVSAIDAIVAKKEVRDLSILYAPDHSLDSAPDESDSTDESCKIYATIESSDPESIDVSINATKADCPDLVKGASQLSEYEFQVSSQTGVKCSGANFSSLTGRKTLSEIGKLDFADFGCNLKTSKYGTRSRIYVKMQLGAQEGSQKTVIFSENDSEESNKGEHCFRNPVADKYEVSPCKSISWSKSYWGDAANLNQPYDPDSETSGPLLVRTEVFLSGTTYAPGNIFFQSGSARLTANSWHGDLEYIGAFQQPEVTLKSGEEEITFRLPSQKPGENDSGLTLAKPVQNILRNIRKVIF